MGCGAQSRVAPPDYHGGVQHGRNEQVSEVSPADHEENESKTRVGEQEKQKTDTDICGEPQEVKQWGSPPKTTEEQPHCKEDTDGDILSKQEIDFENTLIVNKQEVVVNTHEICNITSSDVADKQQDTNPEQQTVEKTLHVNKQQKCCNDELIAEHMWVEEAITPATEQVEAINSPKAGSALDDDSGIPLACDNSLVSPQQHSNTAVSLSQSPRIVGLQLELGFVNVTCAELDQLHSWWNPKGREDILADLGIS